jgi:hypothetical protein
VLALRKQVKVIAPFGGASSICEPQKSRCDCLQTRVEARLKSYGSRSKFVVFAVLRTFFSFLVAL